MPISAVDTAYENARNRWSGCDWSVYFGDLKLPLARITAKQARIMANATAGQESEQWEAACAWLSEVEKAARIAEIAANQAHEASICGDWEAARKQAELACSLESAYRPVTVWKGLRAAIQAEATMSLGVGGQAHTVH